MYLGNVGIQNGKCRNNLTISVAVGSSGGAICGLQFLRSDKIHQQHVDLHSKNYFTFYESQETYKRPHNYCG